jgi:hypothetical protein
MKVRALRGVCIGVERHLLPGETADLEASTAAYLTSIGAVVAVVEAAPAPAVEVVEAAPAPAVEVVESAPAPAVEVAPTESEQPPAKAGKKEK